MNANNGSMEVTPEIHQNLLSAKHLPCRKGSHQEICWHFKLNLISINCLFNMYNYYYFIFLLFLVGLDWVRLVLQPLFGLQYQPRMINDGDCGAIGGIKIDRGNRSTRRKPTPVPLCPPQIPQDLTRPRTRAAAVESQRLTAWAMTRP
jgi:hypothetical protein